MVLGKKKTVAVNSLNNKQQNGARGILQQQVLVSHSKSLSLNNSTNILVPNKYLSSSTGATKMNMVHSHTHVHTHLNGNNLKTLRYKELQNFTFSNSSI